MLLRLAGLACLVGACGRIGYDELSMTALDDGGNQNDLSDSGNQGGVDASSTVGGAAVTCQQDETIFVVGSPGIAAGSWILISMLADQAPNLSVIDDAGNSYLQGSGFPAAQGLQTQLLEGDIVGALNTGDRIVLSHPGAFNFAACLTVFPDTVGPSAGSNVFLSSGTNISYDVEHGGPGYLTCSLFIDDAFDFTPDSSFTLETEYNEGCGRPGPVGRNVVFWKFVSGPGPTACEGTIAGQVRSSPLTPIFFQQPHKTSLGSGCPNCSERNECPPNAPGP